MSGLSLPRSRSILADKWASGADALPNDLPLTAAIAWGATRSLRVVSGAIACISHYGQDDETIGLMVSAEALRGDVAALWCKCHQTPCECCDRVALAIVAACASGAIVMQGRETYLDRERRQFEAGSVKPVPANAFNDDHVLVWDGSIVPGRRQHWRDLAIPRHGLVTLFPPTGSNAGPITVALETKCRTWLVDLFQKESRAGAKALTKAQYRDLAVREFGALGAKPWSRIWTAATEHDEGRRRAGAKPKA